MEEISSALDSADQTLEDVKKLVNRYVAKKLVSSHDAGQIITKWKNSERRRIGRQMEKSNNAVFYFCHLFLGLVIL